MSEQNTLDIDDIHSAQRRLAEFIRYTPVVESKTDELVGLFLKSSSRKKSTSV